jgi:hypothetical protein
MMEKYDGVRVFWDGKLRVQGSKKIIEVPNNIVFPMLPFEGELWYVSSVISTCR